MMKKTTGIFSMLLVTSFLISCSSSIESDADKLANMQCKSYELFEKVGKGQAKIEESTALLAEMELFNKEMKEKYTLDQDKKKFDEACLKAVAKGCK